jgi:hypothetical protein
MVRKALDFTKHVIWVSQVVIGLVCSQSDAIPEAKDHSHTMSLLLHNRQVSELPISPCVHSSFTETLPHLLSYFPQYFCCGGAHLNRSTNVALRNCFQDIVICIRQVFAKSQELHLEGTQVDLSLPNPVVLL